MTNPESPIYDQSEPRVNEGLTKREMFAAMAMQGLCTHAGARYQSGPCDAHIVQRSVFLADALISQLNKPSK